jgi:diguanylate cyclase (GGDEF)-like protein
MGSFFGGPHAEFAWARRPSTVHPWERMRRKEEERQLGTILRRSGWVMSVMLIGFAAMFSWQAWTVVKAEQAAELKTVVELGEKTIDIYLGKSGAALDSLSQQLVDTGTPIDPQRGHLLIKRFHLVHAELLNVTLTRADGQLMFSALHEPGAPLPSLAQQQFFKDYLAQQKPGAAFDIGRPQTSPLQKEWFVPLRYAIRDQAGQLRFILLAQLPVDFIQAFWKEAPIASRATIGLLRDDGFVLSQYPETRLGNLEQVYGKPRTGALIDHLRQSAFPASGSLEGASSLAPTELLQAYKRLHHFPVTLFAAMPLSEIRVAWWGKVQVPYFLLILLFVGIWTVYQVARQRQHAWGLEQKRSEEVRTQLAYFDPLTGLPNRRLLMDRMDQALITARRSGLVGAVMFVDLDNFKNINDARGHAVGDALLMAVASRLSDLLREEDSLARIGGDEFVLLIPGRAKDLISGARKALVVAEKVRDALAQPLDIDGQTYTAHGSIGVTLMPKEGETSNDLLREADTAMYRAKKAGRNRIVFFEASMQAEVQERLALEEDLKRAIARDELQMYVQPQVDRTGQTVGAELLLRWHHFSRGFISPADFIPVAEQSGLILLLGDWVLQQACGALVQLQAAGSDIQLSINVSPKEFRQPGFVDRVAAVLAQTGARASHLILEVTEGLLIDQLDETITRMNQLKQLGVRFSIDDFGTGFSSLGYLKFLPIDEIKIDQSFVKDLPNNKGDIAIVMSVLSMAEQFEIKVVAEGVESPRQAEFLIQHGCDLLQGFLYARPMPMRTWIEAQINTHQFSA